MMHAFKVHQSWFVVSGCLSPILGRFSYCLDVRVASHYDGNALLLRWSTAIFSGQFCITNNAKTLPLGHVSAVTKEIFPSGETIWRRERDSNPRYGFPYSGFQVLCFKMLSCSLNHLQSSLLTLNHEK